MINLKKINTGLYAAMLLTIFTAGCKKDDIIKIQPPGNTPVVQELAIEFSATGVPQQNIESATILWRDANNNTIIKSELLQSRAGALYCSLTGFAAGSYKAEIAIRTKKDVDDIANEYALTKTVTLPLTANLRLKSPAGNFEDDWYKRVVLFANNEEATAIIAMDPRDAFYEVKFKAAGWKSAILQRAALNNSTVVADMEHAKNLPGLIGFAEYTAFDPFTEAMAGKSWTKATISLYIEHQDGHPVYLDYAYFK